MVTFREIKITGHCKLFDTADLVKWMQEISNLHNAIVNFEIYGDTHTFTVINDKNGVIKLEDVQVLIYYLVHPRYQNATLDYEIESTNRDLFISLSFTPPNIN